MIECATLRKEYSLADIISTTESANVLIPFIFQSEDLYLHAAQDYTNIYQYQVRCHVKHLLQIVVYCIRKVLSDISSKALIIVNYL